MPNRATIGIDVGGTKVLLGLFDGKFRIIEDVKFKTHPEKGEKYFTSHLKESLEPLLAKVKKEGLMLMGIGAGCAGYVDREKGIVKSSPNIPFLKDYPFARHLSQLTDARVILGNDVQMGLYGEYTLGAAVGMPNVIGIFFGTGIGGALIIHDKLFTGAGGCAGDIGHYLLSPMGTLSGSEREGVLDSVVSRSAIAGEAATIASKQGAPHLLEMAGTDVAEIRGGVLAKSIKNGDKKIEEMVRSRARMAGIVLSNMVDFLNPNMVVLGGGLVDALPTIFLEEVEAGIRDHATAESQKDLKVVVSKLQDHAVTAGAAKMVWDMFVPAGKTVLV